MHASNEQASNHVERTATIKLRGAPDAVFPLFGPDREREWAAQWEPEAIYPERVVAEEGAVFRTRHGGEAIWVVNRYNERKRVVEYTNFRHENRVTCIRISVSGDPDNADWSVASVTYSLTALSENGAQIVAHMSESHYEVMMEEWEREINAILK